MKNLKLNQLKYLKFRIPRMLNSPSMLSLITFRRTTLREMLRNTMANPGKRLTLRTNISSTLKLHAWSLLRSIKVIKKSAATVEQQRHQRSSGNGIPHLRSGIDGLNTVSHGLTGVHPRAASPPLDGLGIEATGITVALPTNTKKVPGQDIRTEDGFLSTRRSQSTHPHHKAKDNVDLSTREWSQDSVPCFQKRSSQDARLVKQSICTRMLRAAISLVVNSFISPVTNVKITAMTNGEEWPSASMSQRWLVKVSSNLSKKSQKCGQEPVLPANATKKWLRKFWTPKLTEVTHSLTIRIRSTGLRLSSTQELTLPSLVWCQVSPNLLSNPTTSMLSSNIWMARRPSNTASSESQHGEQTKLPRSNYGKEKSKTCTRLTTSSKTPEKELKPSTSQSLLSINKTVQNYQRLSKKSEARRNELTSKNDHNI